MFKIILANIELLSLRSFLLLASDLAGLLLLQPKRELISHTSANGGAGLVCLFGASVQRWSEQRGQRNFRRACGDALTVRTLRKFEVDNGNRSVTLL